MESINSIVVWVFTNTIFPILPILIVFSYVKLSNKKFKHLKIYQFIARNDGLALYSCIVSVSSLPKPISYIFSKYNSYDSITEGKQTLILTLFLITIFILMLSFGAYCFLLNKSITSENLYSPENDSDDATEKILAIGIILLALASTIFSFFMNLKTGGL